MLTLLITIGSLRKDHLSFYGYERGTTPFSRPTSRRKHSFQKLLLSKLPHKRKYTSNTNLETAPMATTD